MDLRILVSLFAIFLLARCDETAVDNTVERSNATQQENKTVGAVEKPNLCIACNCTGNQSKIITRDLAIEETRDVQLTHA